jgi:hypothetical protein
MVGIQVIHRQSVKNNPQSARAMSGSRPAASGSE